MAGLPRYKIDVIISNKPAIRDPEGETILHDLMIRHGYNHVKSVRTAKVLQMEIEAESVENAKRKALEMCGELRIYNPVVSSCSVRVDGE